MEFYFSGTTLDVSLLQRLDEIHAILNDLHLEIRKNIEECYQDSEHLSLVEPKPVQVDIEEYVVNGELFVTYVAGIKLGGEYSVEIKDGAIEDWWAGP